MISSIQAHRPLDGLTTFGTEADHYAEAGSLDELEAHLAEANANGLPVHFLGAGANTIAMSRVPGMTIRITIKGVEMSAAPNGDVLVKCGAGEVFDDIVARTLKAGHSIMKTEAGRNFVVLSVTLRLPAVWTPVLGYKDLEAEIEARGLTAETVTAPVMSEIVRAVRARKLPDPAVIGNAGSFFTNPIVTKVHWHELLTKHPSLVYYRLGGGRMKLAAAWLIEAAGFKGLAEGPAGVYEHHALIIVNRGGATGEDVMALAERIQKRVFELFGVKLEMEPVRLG